jgi:tetratricopeptide (TPR) repeat protein
MRPSTFAASIAALLFTTGTALSQDEHAGHGGHDKVGTVNFSNSCAPAVQADFARGVAMLHSFWYSAGEPTFRAVLANDPTCAIADWGIAAILMSNPLNGVGPTPKDAEKAQAAIDQGRRIGAKTQRERDYIEAVAAYYQDWASRPERARQESRAAAFEALAARYPDDDEAEIFSALYIAGTQKQADQTYAAYSKAAAILEKEFVKYPDHPGVAHYLIHVYDAPPLAAQGLTAARRYAGIAPDAPHALHMPSHIFTRVGAWEDSVATNRRSYAAAIKGNEFPEAYHASDYAVYADLQLARDAAALSAIADAFKIKVSPPGPPAVSYASAAMPARYALERGDWGGAMQLVPAAGGVPYSEAITWFARALGAARMGDVGAAEQDEAELAVRHKALVEAGNVYWATEVEVQQRAAAAWIAFARKDTDDAMKLMRDAADLEDKHEKHIVTPGRVLPARELLGDMLLEAGQPALALREYEASQRREPNRFRGYYGAARAAEGAGDRDKAAAYYGKLLALAKNADTERPELVLARAYVAR